MISLDHLCKTLATCKDIPYNLSKINDMSGGVYLQKDAVQIQLARLDLPPAIDAGDAPAEEVVLVAPPSSPVVQQPAIHDFAIPSRALMNYQENTNIIQLPEILLEAFRGKPEMDFRFLYGFKNPESFFKSVLILTRPDFIIKGKYDRMSTVYTFKKEIGMQIGTYFRKLDYRQMKFKQTELTTHLVSKEHYHSYDLMVLCADYCNINLFIIDIVKSTYTEIKYKSVKGEVPNHENYYILVRYINNTFLPLLSRKCHQVSNNTITKLRKYFTDESSLVDIGYIPRVNKTEGQPNLVSSDKSSIALRLAATIDMEELVPITPKFDMSVVEEIVPSHKPSSVSVPQQNPTAKEQMKPLTSYTLPDLQKLAVDASIEIKKTGKTGNPVNKTKQELYDELSRL